MIVDVHAHMDFDDFKDMERFLESFRKNHVVAVVSNGVDVKSNRKNLELSKKYPVIKTALGMYPTHCLEMIKKDLKSFDEEIKFIEAHIKNKKAIAIGEVGLDYYEIKNISDDDKKLMKECLRRFIEISKKYDVPIIIHSRGAEFDVVELLEKEDMKNKKVIMHCFSGHKNLIKKIMDNGWFFSIPCNIIRSQQFQDMVKDVPIGQLLTETDSPYLAPNKEETNTLVNISHTIKKIAQIKELTEEETSNIIYSNYQRIFL